MIPKGATAMVVNDDPGQLRLISGLLQRYGMDVDGYVRPDKAIRELQRRGPVDLLVVDLHMPALDGWKFCRLVRSDEFPGFEEMPILVASATFSGADVEEISAQLGANAFLPVPFLPETFKRYVDDLLAGRMPKYVPQALVIDDNPSVRGAVGKIFENAGYRVSLAMDGLEGLSMYRRLRPDLVILDYHLPDITGEAFLETIKRPGNPAVVLVVTGDTDPQVAVNVLRKGADGYVRKPFDAEYLVDTAARAKRERALLRVEEILELRTQELRASEERYRGLFATIPEIILIADRDGTIVQTNDVGERTLGRKGQKLIGLTLSELVKEDQIPQLQEALRVIWQTGEGELATQLLTGLGEIRDFEVSARTVEFQGSRSILLIARDVTDRNYMEEERKRLHAQVLQNQKLESLGVMAGGIAHDFNNLLTGILGNAGLVLMDLEEGHPAKELVQEIDVASRRAAELTGQILNYTGKRRAYFERVALDELVREMKPLMEPAVSKKASLRVDLEPGLPKIKADPAQLRQVVINLILNASEALEGASGSVEVRVSSIQAKRELLRRGFVGQDLPAGQYLVLEVSDSGCGMDSETVTRIFDPFFTTKFTGRGLGLASSLGIVRSHTGAILVESRKGKGTTFRLLFPTVMDQNTTQDKDQERTESTPVAQQSRTPVCVLVVDDEPAVRRLARATLKRVGISTVLTEDGSDGLRTFREKKGAFDAVLLDFTMPRLNGREVLEGIRALDQEIPVVLSSGLSDEAARNGIDGDPNIQFLTKPYLPEMLLEIISSVTGHGDGRDEPTLSIA